MKGSPTKNLPAAETCRNRNWCEGMILVSDRWSNPRVIVSIQKAFVTLRTFREGPAAVQRREPDGTFAKMHGALGGRKPAHVERVRSLPSDVTLFNNGDR